MKQSQTVLTPAGILQSNENYYFSFDLIFFYRSHFDEISLPGEFKINQSNSDNKLNNNVEDMNTLTVDHRRSDFLSEIPFVSSIEKPKKIETCRLKFFEIYRFADKLDVLLMITGTIAGSFYLNFLKHIFKKMFCLALLTGVVFSLMLFLYGKVINSLVDMKNLQTITNDSSITFNNNSGEWYFEIIFRICSI